MSPKSFLQLLSFLSLITRFALAENILFYFALTGFSHVTSIWPLAVALAEKGHNVTVLSAQPVQTAVKVSTGKLPINLIFSEELLQVMSSLVDEDADLILERMTGNKDGFWDALPYLGIQSCERLLTSSKLAPLVHSSQFDLVIFDTSYNECGVMLAHHKYNAPYIAYAPVPPSTVYFDSYGFFPETSAITDMESESVAPISFYEKLVSTLIQLKFIYIRMTYYYPEMEKLFQEKLGLTDRPSLVQLNADTSLILMNTFHSTHYARQYPANIVQIGGMHIAGKTKPLPPEISNFLNGSEFVYVSFGTAVRVSKSDSALQNKFFNALGNMTSFKFLWKWDGASLPTNTPGNIYFAKWLPQQDLYAHEKIRGMIGHGGINGIHEAVYYGVPMILFPFFADQDLNVNIMAKKGLGIKLEITDFTQQDLEQALEEIITNSRYKRNLVEASRVFNDRPMSPTETALWWTEYVLRNKGSKPLKSLSSDQSWYERRLLDVWLFIFLCAQASLIIVALISYQLYKLVRPRFQKSYTIHVKKAQ